MPDLHHEIADLEAEIESLSESAERVRKTLQLAKVTAIGGGLLLLAAATGLFRLGPLALVIGIAAILGGIALYGSSRSTLDQIAATLAARTARRDALIDELGLRAVTP